LPEWHEGLRYARDQRSRRQFAREPSGWSWCRCLLACLDYRDFKQQVAMIQLTKGLADLVFRAERPEGLGLADRPGRRGNLRRVI